MELKKRMQRAEKRESGIRLSPLEVKMILSRLEWNSPLPEKKSKKRKHKSKDPIEVHIRWMIRRDMPETMKIDHESFVEPWSEEDFIRCLRQRNCIGMVAEHDEKVLSSMIYELNPDHLNVLRFAVGKKHRAKSIGRQMINKLKSKLSQQKRQSVQIDVDENNLPGLLFLKSMDFSPISIIDDNIQMQFSVCGFTPFDKDAGRGGSYDVKEFVFDDDDDDDDEESS